MNVVILWCGGEGGDLVRPTPSSSTTDDGVLADSVGARQAVNINETVGEFCSSSRYALSTMILFISTQWHSAAFISDGVLILRHPAIIITLSSFSGVMTRGSFRYIAARRCQSLPVFTKVARPLHITISKRLMVRKPRASQMQLGGALPTRVFAGSDHPLRSRSSDVPVNALNN